MDTETAGFDFASMTRPSHGRFRCTFQGCSKDYSHRRQCEDHFCYTHLNTPRYRCDLCSKTFSFQENWKNHNKNTHHGNDMNVSGGDTNFASSGAMSSPRLQAQLQQQSRNGVNGTRVHHNASPLSRPPPPKLLPAPKVSAQHLLYNHSRSQSSSPGPVNSQQQRYTPANPLTATGTVRNPSLKLILKVPPRSIKHESPSIVSSTSFRDERSQREIEAEEGFHHEVDERDQRLHHEVKHEEKMNIDIKTEMKSELPSSSKTDTTVSYPSLRTRLSAPPSVPTTSDPTPDDQSVPLKLPFLRCKCCSGYFLSRDLFDRHVNLNSDES